MFGALLEDYQNDVVPIFKKVRVRLSSFGEIYSRVPQRSVQQIVKRQIFFLFFQACRGTVHHLCRACCRQILSLPLHYPFFEFSESAEGLQFPGAYTPFPGGPEIDAASK